MLNLKEKGVNGVQSPYEECETEYNNAKGVECYERLKSKAGRLPDSWARCIRCHRQLLRADRQVGPGQAAARHDQGYGGKGRGERRSPTLSRS